MTQQRYLTPDQLARASYLWSERRWDTLMIAQHLRLVPDDPDGRKGEHIVWRSLAEPRDRLARMREFANRVSA